MLLRLLICLCLFALPVAAQTERPNFVVILADDFSANLMPGPNMPNLAQMMQDGAVMNRFYTSNSLCCPSRASILTGMMPHNTGVLTNSPPNGGLEAFIANGNEARTFAIALQAADYVTAFMGKILNGWKPLVSAIPPGWDRFVSTNSYRGYGYTLNDNGVISNPAGVHFTDAIAARALEFIGGATGPFLIELATFSPHSPYTPATRHEGLFLDATIPATPAYGARPDAAAPAWLQAIPPLTTARETGLRNRYILRLQSTVAIDEMIGSVRAQLVTMGIADNTYVIFTSDNGYHMGEFSMGDGKMTPFDFDVRVPFVIVGPGIAPGRRPSAIGMNIDIYPTILELAGLPPSPTVDGRSLVGALMNTPFPKRTMAVIEHTSTDDPDDPDATAAYAGLLPSYIALRGVGWMYVEYASGEVGYYDSNADPEQLHNIAATLTPERLAELHASALANATCAGATCHAAQMR